MSSVATGNSTERDAAAAPIGNVGTLLWIGPRRDPEMIDAYRDCESLVPQLAYRVDVADACQRPAQLVTSVIIARTERSGIAPERLEQLQQAYSQARFICLLGSGCEGETRTGDPWTGCERIYWHRWNQDRGAVVAVPVLSAPPASGDHSLPPLFLAVVAASFGHAEPLLAVASENGWPATWITPGKIPLVRSATHVLWDDSVAQPANRHIWRQRLALFHSRGGLASKPFRPLHGWFAGFPRVHQWEEARAAGVDWLLSKPASLAALIRFLEMR